MKIRWYDWLIYKLFYWRWTPILMNKPILRKVMIDSLLAYEEKEKNKNEVGP